MAEQVTFYEAVGGEETFHRLVHRFYQGVASDPELRAMYPEEDLGPAEERLRLFLIQYWGGPTTYSQRRGHPRLRMRHVPFVIGPGGAGRVAAAHAGRGGRAGPPRRPGEAALGLLHDGGAEHGERSGISG